MDRQRAKQQAVDERKDRRVGADAEGQRQNRDARYDWSGAEYANGDTQVLHGPSSRRAAATSIAI